MRDNRPATDLKLVQRVDVNILDPEKALQELSKMTKVSFDVDFRNIFLQSGILPAGGKYSISFYDTGKWRTDKEIKNLFEINCKFEFRAQYFLPILFSLLNHQVNQVGFPGYLSNSGRSTCFFVSDCGDNKVYTVVVSFKKWPLLEWRVRVFEEDEYRWRTSDWLVVPS